MKAKKATAGERHVANMYGSNVPTVRGCSHSSGEAAIIDRLIARERRKAVKAERGRCVGIVAARRDYSFAKFEAYERGVCDQMIDAIREANP
jgi:hypothetical protein